VQPAAAASSLKKPRWSGEIHAFATFLGHFDRWHMTAGKSCDEQEMAEHFLECLPSNEKQMYGNFRNRPGGVHQWTYSAIRLHLDERMSSFRTNTHLRRMWLDSTPPANVDFDTYLPWYAKWTEQATDIRATADEQLDTFVQAFKGLPLIRAKIVNHMADCQARNITVAVENVHEVVYRHLRRGKFKMALDGEAPADVNAILPPPPSNVPQCQYCKKTGHTAENCFKKKRDADKAAQRPPPKAAKPFTPSAGYRGCLICDSKEHLARHCPMKEKIKELKREQKE
jgi:hypothetical protein